MRLTRLLVGTFAFASAALAQVTLREMEHRVDVEIGGHPATSFLYGPGITKPYLYPLRTPSGAQVTRHFPTETRLEGERSDHIHHRGLWFAHSRVNGVDFWNSDPSYKTPAMGQIVVTGVREIQNGDHRGSFQAMMEWRDRAENILLTEKRVTTFTDGNPRQIDLDITLTAHGQVVFDDEKDGVLGIRLAAQLEGQEKDSPAQPARTGVMTSSNGCHQETECWGKRADWLRVTGDIEGQSVGVTVFDHPANPRHPTYWHVRGYGLLAANIFGERAFTGDKSKNGALTLEDGKSLRFRYRVLIQDGTIATADLYATYSRE